MMLAIDDPSGEQQNEGDVELQKRQRSRGGVQAVIGEAHRHIGDDDDQHGGGNAKIIRHGAEPPDGAIYTEGGKNDRGGDDGADEIGQKCRHSGGG